jgi:hypothetical protein
MFLHYIIFVINALYIFFIIKDIFFLFMFSDNYNNEILINNINNKKVLIIRGHFIINYTQQLLNQ